MFAKLARKSIVVSLLLAAFSAPLWAQGNAGSYLATRQAEVAGDFQAAARYATEALSRDLENPALINAALTAQLSLGDMERAVPLARRLRALEVESQVMNLALFAEHAKSGEWDGLLAELDAGQTVGPLYDGLLRAWAMVGAGQMSGALEQFDTVSEARGTQAFGLYHRALALASVGDMEGADAVFGGENGTTLRLTRRGVMAHAQVLSQLDRGSEGADLIEEVFGVELDPALSELRDKLRAGDQVPFDIVTSPADGIAELHYSIASAISGEAADQYTLLYVRLVQYLNPAHIDGLLLTADILESLENYELATAVYDAVPIGTPYFHAAELGRAQALRNSGRTDAAIEVLTQLGKTHGQLPRVHITLGDFLRSMERYDEAGAAYDRAVGLVPAPEGQHWALFYSRGITREREGRWPEAEADFRQALELNPDQPSVLNYLGYSMVELDLDYDEALQLIEKAVEGQPNSGYIVDSLGWVLYRLGRYEEAVLQMEKAVELLPIDPVVNDHLGDVYWAVGRLREADFQWRRALSLIGEETTDADPDRIRRKIDVGLDTVLEEEGAPPLEVANDDG
jgi:tetratricopeptide (TPR) repeat protein